MGPASRCNDVAKKMPKSGFAVSKKITLNPNDMGPALHCLTTSKRYFLFLESELSHPEKGRQQAGAQ